jgi:hypothetical protein
VQKSTEWQQLGAAVNNVMERLQQRQRAQAEFAGGTAKKFRPAAPRLLRVPVQLELPLTQPLHNRGTAGIEITVETMR